MTVHSHTRSLCVMLFVLVVFGMACASFLLAQSVPKKSTPVEKRIGDLEKDVMSLQRQTDIYNLDAMPDNLILCGKKVPIHKAEVRERFEREFFQILEHRGLLTVIIKRFLQYQPMISEEIRRIGVPEDLAYLAVAESYLNPRALSGASAAGMWQFIRETGQREGLSIDDYIDERYNITKSTRSALTHLKRLNGEFNDWLLAMAAYNAGAGRVREVINNQLTRDFFDMLLPEETERYIFRILSIKELISNRERYGIKIDEKTLYQPVKLAEVTIEANREFHTNVLASAMDLSYRTFRINNLHIRRYRIPKGTYTVNVPAEKKDIFIRKLQSLEHIRIL